MTTFVNRGTAFWLVVSAVAGFAASLYPGSLFLPGEALFVPGLTVAGVQLALAYFSWRGSRWALIGAAIVALAILASTVGYSGLQYPGDELLALVELQVLFFAISSYRPPTPA